MKEAELRKKKTSRKTLADVARQVAPKSKPSKVSMEVQREMNYQRMQRKKQEEEEKRKDAERDENLQKLAMKQKEAEERRKANTKGELRGVGAKVKPAAVKAPQMTDHAKQVKMLKEKKKREEAEHQKKLKKMAERQRAADDRRQQQEEEKKKKKRSCSNERCQQKEILSKYFSPSLLDGALSQGYCAKTSAS